jgi:hypothetical protein
MLPGIEVASLTAGMLLLPPGVQFRSPASLHLRENSDLGSTASVEPKLFGEPFRPEIVAMVQCSKASRNRETGLLTPASS